MRAEAKAEAAEAAARGESGGGAGPDPLRGGLYDDENGRPCASPGDGGQGSYCIVNVVEHLAMHTLRRTCKTIQHCLGPSTVIFQTCKVAC